MSDSPRVVIALCYPSVDKYLIVPECPYCFCQHKHRLPGIKPLAERHTNGAVVPYTEDMPTKISECSDRGRTYALEVREKSEVPQEKKHTCRGTKRDGTPCSKPVRPDYCVCSFHLRQQVGIVEQHYAELTGT